MDVCLTAFSIKMRQFFFLMKHLHIVNNDMIILLKFDLNTFYV